ncbi:MAG: substrate-binding domain-containing protein [Planctomycetales bacterium]|nr:substrate-binding domain-containing protein [Planctomycetales bacterium]
MLKHWGFGGLLLAAMVMGCSGGGGSSDEIIRVSRQNNSGTYAYFREAVLGEDREFKLGSLDQSGSKDVVELVAETPNAIGYSGMGYNTDQVKMLELGEAGSSVPPTVENAQSGSYKLSRNLYLYVIGEPEGAVKHYIDWIRSAAGQKIVSDQGYVAVEAQPDAEGAPPAASIKVKGSDTMVNVAQKWAEDYHALFGDVSPEVSGGGSGTGIAGLIDGTVEIANASREMKQEEKDQIKEKYGVEPTEIVVGMDALAVYVHPSNPLTSITMEDLAEIYGDGGTITHWSQVKGWPKSGE